MMKIMESPVSAPEKDSIKAAQEIRFKALKILKDRLEKIPGVRYDLKDYGDMERLSISYRKTIYKEKRRELVLVSSLDVYYDPTKEMYYHFGSVASTINVSGWISHNKKVHEIPRSRNLSLKSAISEIESYFKEIDKRSTSLSI